MSILRAFLAQNLQIVKNQKLAGNREPSAAYEIVGENCASCVAQSPEKKIQRIFGKIIPFRCCKT